MTNDNLTTYNLVTEFRIPGRNWEWTEDYITRDHRIRITDNDIESARERHADDDWREGTQLRVAVWTIYEGGQDLLEQHPLLTYQHCAECGCGPADPTDTITAESPYCMWCRIDLDAEEVTR